ncbi:ADP-ribose glycohydrolase OARD1 isoform X2 [Suricata suricatta]|uniref:ADP-ribose glycohydrolase OARD1 isoform X2 n=1 Tax=Suricata suricatta TaxID=37032 RepID=UPI0011555358|nr:ADP-ribose glycohydrolase OARD1 isoform X2 [Suricata suricatta]
MAGSPNEDPEGSRITYVKGDLFACPKTDSLAHCISEDCRMGAGIAVLFKKKFGGVQELLNQQKKSGEVAVLKRDGRYIYYLTDKDGKKFLISCQLRSSGGGCLEHCVRKEHEAASELHWEEYCDSYQKPVF